MIIILSPAKTMDYDTPAHIDQHTQPTMLAKANELINLLQDITPAQLATMMKLSDKLAALNVARYASWKPPFTPSNAKQAILAFKGDVYTGLDAAHLSPDDLLWAQNHLRLLSGLYGLLRPLDLMQPYRLEMGTKFANPKGKDLYAFWGQLITQTLNEVLQQDEQPVLVNLASNEYYRAVQPAHIKAPIITPVFKDEKHGTHKIISFYAKKARGMMARWAIQNRVADAESLKTFDSAGYYYCKVSSSDHQWVFLRDHH